MKTRRPPNAGKGRKKGIPNKVTRDVRAALARFAEGNVNRLQKWLDEIAEVDPARAADLYIRVLEYHIPRLQRADVNVTGEVQHYEAVPITVEERQSDGLKPPLAH